MRIFTYRVSDPLLLIGNIVTHARVIGIESEKSPTYSRRLTPIDDYLTLVVLSEVSPWSIPIKAMGGKLLLLKYTGHESALIEAFC